MSRGNFHPDVCSILSKLPDKSLFALTATVTQGLLKEKINDRKGKEYGFDW